MARSTAVVFDLIARDHASRTIIRVGESFTGLERRGASVGAALRRGLAVGATAVAGVAAVSVKAAADFQSSMTKISTQAGGSAKDVKVLSDQVLSLGGKVQQAPKELADSLYHLKSVGMDNVDAMKALREASDLAAVGGASLEDTTNALAGAWRTGIKGATSFHEAVSTVNAIIGAGNMRMADFTAAIGTGILPAAKTFGLSLKQVGAALALMTDEGVPATDAATRLRMSFSLLGAPSKAAEKVLGEIGLTGLQLAQAMRGPDGLIGAIQLLKEHLDASGMSAAEQSQILSRAFGGGRSSSAIMTMVNNLDVLKQKQDQVNKSTSKFDDAVKMQRKTAEAEWKRLESALESGSVRLGTALLPPITGFVTFLNDRAVPAAVRLGRALGSLIPVQQIKQAIGDVESTISGLLSGMTGGSSVGGFLTGLTGRGPKTPKSPIDKFPTTVLQGPLGGAPHLGSGQSSSTRGPGAALQQIPHYGVGQVAPTTGVQGPALQPMPHGGSGLTAPLIIPKAAPPKSAAQQLGETIRSAVTGGIERVDWSKAAGAIGKGLGTALGATLSKTLDFAAWLGKVIGKTDWLSLGKKVGATAIPFIIGFVNNLFEPLFSGSFWSKNWKDIFLFAVTLIPIGRIAGALGKVFEHIPVLRIFKPLLDGIGKLGGWIEKGFGKVLKPLGRFGRAIWDGIVTGFTKVFPEAEGKLTGFIGRLAYNILGYSARYAAAGARLIEGLGNGLLRMAGKVGEWIGRVVGWLVKPFAKAGGWLLSKGRDLILGLVRGIVDRATGIGSWVWRTAGRPMVDAFKSAGSWLFTRGRDLVLGLTRGIIDRAVGIGSWAWRTIAKPPIDAFRAAGSWLWSRGRDFVSGLVGGILNRAAGIGGWVWRTVGSPAVGAFRNAGGWLWDKGAQLISGLKNGIVSGAKGIGGWLKSNLVDPIVDAVKRWFGIRSPSRVFMGIGGHLVSGLVKGLATTNGTAIARTIFGDLPSALGSIVGKGLVSIASLPSKAMKALGSLGSKLGGLFGKLFGGGGGGGAVSRWSGLVASVLAMLGAPAYAQGAVLRRIDIESGGNPNAINLWDINAQNGDPSRGLMQTIGSTFNAYAGPFRGRGIYDPLANIYAGVNYAMHAYGSDWINVMTRPGGYDSGGVATGMGYLPKYTPKPERVLSPRQTVAFDRLVDLIDSGQIGGGGGYFEGQLVLDSGELLGVIKGTVNPMIKASEERQAYRAKVGRRG